MKNEDKFGYASSTTSNIFYEKPNENNPFVAEESYIFGYNTLELARKKSFADVLLLLFTGELPNNEDSKLLDALLVGLINPGPRHPAVRAAMTAGVSKSNSEHLLPIGLMVLGGEDNGAKEVENSMAFLQKNTNNSSIFNNTKCKDICFANGDVKIAPGFGSLYGQRCPITHQLANHLSGLSEKYVYLNQIHQQIIELPSSNIGWLPTGLAAAAFLDLGIKPREGIGLYQLLIAPGIAAHGFEQTHKPLSSMPFLDDSQYELR